MNKTHLIAPEQYNITQELSAYSSDTERTAVRWVDQEGNRRNISYKELSDKMNQFALAFKRQGIQKGDKLLIILPRVPEAYMTYLACLRAGIVAIPSSEMLRKKDLLYRIEHANVKGIVSFHKTTGEINAIDESHPALSKKFIVGGEETGWMSLEALAAEESTDYEGEPTSRDDMSFLSYTSGTTGNPKGVVHTHGWGYAHVRTAAKEWLGVEEGDLVWATAAPGWQKWIWSPFLSTITLGATAFVYHGSFDPETYLTFLEKEKINVLCCTPTEYRLMAKVDDLDTYKLPELKSAVSAGEPLNRPVIEAFRSAFNVDVRDGYGQTENTLLVCNVKGMPTKPGSMGKPTPGNPVDIINEDGDPCQAGEVGDIAVHKNCAALFKEYLDDPERTHASFRGDWYLTGDHAMKDEDGYFWFKGRSDDIIISSGYTIGPFEVEDALVKHPAVRECAVVASPDETRGSIVKAFIVLKDPDRVPDEALVKELQDHTKQITAPYKYPRQITFLEELPKTTSGKIRRIDLRLKEQMT
ncbi:acyl-CoA synthetase MbcS [Salipaludibacillus aurantiacus]|uniref:Acetyl-CoA synthetase n=1 Tax=Salipaludibacillus aurantiacus TaxID=1601833 RepID=A0A1H9VK74_9BACI|nr:acyl--CoA ligase [Salipaludibacillus aurantiacus]SES21979.1 acetyl-CoA synthetase [Salipaludibacillus aurantiacus]